MTKLRNARSGDTHTIMHWCPGCKNVHGIRVSGPGPNWAFNQNMESPTFNPSVLISYDDDEDENGNPLPTRVRRTECHYFIRAGKIEFCSDSAHELKGQTVDLPDWPYAHGTFGGIDE